MPKMDSRMKSLCEAGSDISIGFAINFWLNYFILPPYAEGIANQDMIALLQIGFWFTLVAIVRKYLVRRLFENMRKNKSWNNFKERLDKVCHLRNIYDRT